MIEYRALFVGGARYEVGDHVEVRPLRGARGGGTASEASVATAGATGGASGDAATESRVLGTLHSLYQIVDGCSRERIPMIDLVPLSAATFAGPGAARESEPAYSESDVTAPGASEKLLEQVVDSYLASSLVRRVEEGEFRRKGRALLSLRPTKLEWVECRCAGPIRGRRPPLTPVAAGSETQPYRIAIAVAGADGRPLARQTAGATVTMVAQHRETGFEWTVSVSAETSSDVVRLGQYVFSLLPPRDQGGGNNYGGIGNGAGCPPSMASGCSSAVLVAAAAAGHSSVGLGHFVVAGTYHYRFRCVELVLQAKEFSVTVLPASPARLSIRCNETAAQGGWVREIRDRARALRRAIRASGTGGDEGDDDDDYNDDGEAWSGARDAGAFGSAALPVPARVGEAVKAMRVAVEDIFGNLVAWSESTAVASGRCGVDPAEKERLLMHTQQQQQQQQQQQLLAVPRFPDLGASMQPLAPEEGEDERSDASCLPGQGLCSSGRAVSGRDGSSGGGTAHVRIQVEVVEPVGGRLAVGYRWIAPCSEEGLGGQGRPHPTEHRGLERRLEVTLEGVLNPPAPPGRAGTVGVAVASFPGQRPLGPWEEVVRLRLRGWVDDPAGGPSIELGATDFWFNLGCGRPHALRVSVQE